MEETHVRWLQGMFDRQRFMALLGVEVRSFGEGRCELALPYRPDLDQHSGIVHAGAVSALADNAAGGAASSLMPMGSVSLTVEYKISFVAPARGQRLVARAEVVRAGRTLTHCESRVYAVEGNTETLCAIALVTLWPERVDEGA